MAISPLTANHNSGGMQMKSQDYWQMFLETGAPELYLLFNNARKMENTHVLDNPGPGAQGHNLQ